MNNNAKKWVAALRDPEAKQITGCLETTEGKCVLGFSCRLYANEYPEWPVTFTSMGTDFGYQSEGALLPLEVQEWLGLATDHGRIMDSPALYDLNDTGTTLPELADLIESEPEGLFV